MDLIQFLKKYQLILLLSFLAISMFIVKLFYGYKGTEVKPLAQISPTPIVTIIPTVVVEKEASESATNKLILPYTTKDFIVEEFDSVSTFKVKLLNSDKSVVIQEIIKWLEKNKLNPVDYQVVFVN